MSRDQSKKPIKVFGKHAMATQVLGLDDAKQITYLIRSGKITKPSYYIGNRPVWTEEDAALSQEMAFATVPATIPPPPRKKSEGVVHG